MQNCCEANEKCLRTRASPNGALCAVVEGRQIHSDRRLHVTVPRWKLALPPSLAARSVIIMAGRTCATSCDADVQTFETEMALVVVVGRRLTETQCDMSTQCNDLIMPVCAESPTSETPGDSGTPGALEHSQL